MLQGCCPRVFSTATWVQKTNFSLASGYATWERIGFSKELALLLHRVNFVTDCVFLFAMFTGELRIKFIFKFKNWVRE